MKINILNNSKIIYYKKLITIILTFILIFSIFSIIQIPTINSNLINSSVLKKHKTILIQGNSEFTSNNGVVKGSGIKNDPYIIENWSIDATITHGIKITNTTDYFIIRNCYIYNGTNQSNINEGIYLNNVRNGTIENNIILYNNKGIVLIDSDNIIINNNTFSNDVNEIEFFINSNNNTISNNICRTIGMGIVISRSKNNLISNNTCFSTFIKNNLAIWIVKSDSNIVTNNFCSNRSIGILLSDSNFNIIDNNKCYSCDYGIKLESWHSKKCNGNIVKNCTSNSNKYGIHLSGRTESLKYNKIINCTFESNKKYGIYLDNTDDNIIFNNFINNRNNSFVSTIISNIWNITKTKKENIIGGPYLGGNYWSNYSGKDLNNDGLGDTKIPFNPGDFLPLVDTIPPGISDITSGNPTTGDEFVFKALVWDNIFISDVFLEYCFNDSMHINVSMKRINGDNKFGNYSRNISVLSNALNISYNLSVMGLDGKWNSTNIKVIKVIDNDKPVLVNDYSESIAYTNETYNFSVLLDDNIAPISASTEYYFDNVGHIKYFKLNKDRNHFNGSIKIPNSLEKLNYRFLFNDSNPDNDNSTKFKNIEVIDREKPLILTGSGNILTTTGEKFVVFARVLDNIEIELVELYFTKGNNYTKWPIVSNNNNYSISNDGIYINTSNNDSDWKYYFYIEDKSGNNNTYGSSEEPYSITIIDNDRPRANAGKDINTKLKNNRVSIIFDGTNSTDNIEIINYCWSFDYNNKPKKLIGKKTEFIFSSTGSFNITLNVSDATGNWDTDILNVLISQESKPDIYLLYPKNDSIVIGPNVKLQWMTKYPKVELITYDLYFGSTMKPQKIESNISTTEFEINDLLDKSRYYWRIKPWLGDVPGIISPTWEFRVEYVPLPDFSIEIKINKSFLNIEQGNSASVKLSVINHGNIDNRINLGIEKNDYSFDMELSKTQIYITPEKSIGLLLNITSNNSSSIGRYKVTIDAISISAQEYGLNESDTVLLTVEIIKKHKVIVTDSDKDGYPDYTDAFPNNPTQWLDSDGDNYGDNLNGTNPDYYPNDPSKWKKDDVPPDIKKPEDKKGDNTWLIVSAAIIIIIIILILIFFLLMKRKKKGEEVQELQPAAETEKQIQQQFSPQPQQKPPPQQPQNLYPPPYQPPILPDR